MNLLTHVNHTHGRIRAKQVSTRDNPRSHPWRNTWAISLYQLVTEINHLLVEIKRPNDPLELPNSRYNTRNLRGKEGVITTHNLRFLFIYSKVVYKRTQRGIYKPPWLATFPPFLASKFKFKHTWGRDQIWGRTNIPSSYTTSPPS
jgi:hypothetical protein